MADRNETPEVIAEAVYHRVFRTDFTQPGFSLIKSGPDCGSERQRQLIIGLKNELSLTECRRRSQELVFQSMTRFDQQVTTKPHLDGGPDESILMLGYLDSDMFAGIVENTSPTRQRVNKSQSVHSLALRA